MSSLNFRQGRETTISILEQLGYEVNTKTFLFKLRQEERTPSAHVDKKGGIVDYGSDFRGTIVDVLMFRGMSQGDAIAEAKRLFGFSDEKPSSYTKIQKLPAQKVQESVPEKSPILDVEKVDFYMKNSKKFYSYYIGILRQLLPSLASDNDRLALAEKFQIGYSSGIKRLIMPIWSSNGVLTNFWKYNKEQEVKVLFESGCRRGAFDMRQMLEYRKSPDEVILICEGEKDVLNAIGNGYRAITPGSSTTPFSKSDLHLFEGLRFAIYGDFDDAGFGFGKHISEQLKGIAKAVRIIDWEKDVFSKYPTLQPQKGFDLTDLLTYKRSLK